MQKLLLIIVTLCFMVKITVQENCTFIKNITNSVELKCLEGDAQIHIWIAALKRQVQTVTFECSQFVVDVSEMIPKFNKSFFSKNGRIEMRFISCPYPKRIDVLEEKTGKIIQFSFSKGFPIQIVKSQMFHGIAEVFGLKLPDCGITTVESKAFSELSNLEHIDLSRNNITKITPEMFQYNVNLKNFELESNIGEITFLSGCFGWNEKLTRVYVRGSKSVVLQDNLLSVNSSLHILNLDRTNLVIFNR